MKIEKSIPIPMPFDYVGRTALAMEVGDSVVCATSGAAVYLYRLLKNKNRTCTRRKLDGGGYRVWRTS